MSSPSVRFPYRYRRYISCLLIFQSVLRPLVCRSCCLPGYPSLFTQAFTAFYIGPFVTPSFEIKSGYKRSAGEGGRKEAFMAASAGGIESIEHIAVVVRDLDRAMEHYTNDLGMGPWVVYT